MTAKKKSKAPAQAPSPESDRQAVAQWWRQRMEEIELEHAKRIELLRTVGEHPSPIFAQQVRTFGALGMPVMLVAKLLGMGPAVMLQHYGDDYELGTAEVISSVAANMWRIATTQTDSAAARVGMEILSRRGGEAWRPPAQKLNLIDDRDTPKNVIDSSQLSVEDRQTLREILTRQLNGEAEPLQLSQDEAS